MSTMVSLDVTGLKDVDMFRNHQVSCKVWGVCVCVRASNFCRRWKAVIHMEDCTAQKRQEASLATTEGTEGHQSHLQIAPLRKILAC